MTGVLREQVAMKVHEKEATLQWLAGKKARLACNDMACKSALCGKAPKRGCTE